MKLSIIVPVYKAEQYLRKCVDSLLAQTLEDSEIILVNDGSPDASQEIIDDYAARFPQKVIGIRIDNGGQGRARNFGIERARGEFLGFVDSDDWVEPTMYEKLVGTAETEGADVAVCAILHQYEDGQQSIEPPVRADYAVASAGSSCNKVFRRSVVGEIRFPQGGLWYEDFDFSAKLLMRAGKVAYLQEPLYIYRCGQLSTMHNNNARKNLDLLTVMEDVRAFAEQGNGSRDEFEYLLINHVLLEAINRLAEQDNPEKTEVIRKLRAYVHEKLPKLDACPSYHRVDRNRQIIMKLNYSGKEQVSQLLLKAKKMLRP